jgi:hypothetical protein
MLTNTVGITLFILAFTVLVTGGAVVVRRLPIETQNDAVPLYFLCLSDRVAPVTPNIVESSLGITNIVFSSETDAEDCSRRLDGAMAEDNYFKCKATTDGILRGHFSDGRSAYEPDLTTTYTYKPGTGYSTNWLTDPHSPFLLTLATNWPKEKFTYFYVQTNALHTFWLVRDISGKHGFRSGWIPLASTKFMTGTGDGVRATSQ